MKRREFIALLGGGGGVADGRGRTAGRDAGDRRSKVVNPTGYRWKLAVTGGHGVKALKREPAMSWRPKRSF